MCQQEQIEVLATEDRKEPALLSNYAGTMNKKLDYASTLEARDYKGFGLQAMNGAIEIERKE